MLLGSKPVELGKRRRWICALSLSIAIALFTVAAEAEAQLTQADGDQTAIQFSADELSVDRELGIVTARGRVEVNRLDRTLISDTMSYNRQTDILTASGNVTLLEPSGDVIFADHLEVTGNLKNGIISDIRMVLSDRSRFAANGARRINDDLELRKAVYSPCNLCSDNPNTAPLWQVKAVKVYHDKSRRMVEYSDAWLEVAGYPVFYTPFLAHPDPTVDRETGFLAPTIGNSTDLGFITKLPYFIRIDEQSDLTLTPAYYGDPGPALEAEYRHRLFDGFVDVEGSIVEDDQEGLRGHLRSEGEFDVDRTWRWGYRANAVSDDTYYRRYGFPQNEDTLTSTLYSEGFRRRNYARIEGFHFQGLESDDDEDSTPFVLPLVAFQHVGEPDRYGGQFYIDAGLASLTRNEGVDSHRVSVHPGWRNTYVSDAGEFYTLSATLKGDLYYAANQPEADGSGTFEGVTGRLFPQAKLDWRLPLVRENDSTIHTLEPIASLVLGPNGSNPSDIPNEDSIDIEFDETSLFRANRSAGHDRVESGSRVDYGFQWTGDWQDDGQASFLIGQSFRFRDNREFSEGSGLEDQLSDVVAKVDIRPARHLDLSYRTRIDKEDAELRRTEVSMNAGVPAFRLTTNYRNIKAQQESSFGGREDLNAVISSQFSRYWRGQFDTLHDFADGQTRQFGLGLTYEDECLIFTSRFTRSFFKDRDLRPSDTILFQVSLKTLGDFQSDVF